MTNQTSTLPRWDLTTIFPSLDSPEFAEAKALLNLEIGALNRLMSQLENATGDEGWSLFDQFYPRYVALVDAASKTLGFASLSAEIDASSMEAQRAQATEAARAGELDNLAGKNAAWLGTIDIEALIANSEVAADFEPILRRERIRSTHLMSADEEELATVLSLTGSVAWSKLHRSTMAMLTEPLASDPNQLPLSMGELDACGSDPDREVRREASIAIDTALERVSESVTAALNAIKGEAIELTKRRDWESPLALALSINGIDRPILDAMFSASRDATPIFARYFRAKAKLLGLPLLAAYDISAPVGSASASMNFDEGVEFLSRQLAEFSDSAANLLERALERRWIDAEPRPGKSPGGFCDFVEPGVFRILMNWEDGYNGVSTLAHELGHAFHIEMIGKYGRHLVQLQPPPMGLIETPSTFFEAMVRDSALRDAQPNEQIAILDGWLRSAAMMTLSTRAVFDLEDWIFAERAVQELASEDVSDRLLAATEEAFDNAVDLTTFQRFLWVGVPHLFISDLHYYNFPYSFGLLFTVGILRSRDLQPEGFTDRFEHFVAGIGLQPAAELAMQFGIDLSDVAFWRGAIEILERDVDKFEALVAATLAA